MEILDDHRQTRLVHLIEQGALEPALELLKDDNHFSEEELNESLISACQHGHTFIIQTLVQLGANVNYRDTDGNTPLLISVQNGLTDIVKFFLTNKANVNAYNSVGDSALIFSIDSPGSTKITKILLKQTGINIAHQNQNGYTAIMKAAEVKDVDTLKILLDEYFNVGCITTSGLSYEFINEHKTHALISTLRDSVNCRGENVLQIAERCGVGSVFQLLQEHESTKISPLELAMRENDIKSFNIFLDCDFIYANNKKYLHEAFVKIVQTCSKDGVIHFNENEIAMMKSLLEHGADVNKTWFDPIPLLDREQAERKTYIYTWKVNATQIAAKSGCFKVLELLLPFKANVNWYDFCSSPLHIALCHGHTECAELLIQHGANIDFEEVLMLAVEQQVPSYVRFLIGNYEKEVMEYLNRTSIIQDILFESVRKGNLEIIGHILDLGAYINCVIFSDKCPLAESKNGEVAKFLIDRGAEVKQITHWPNHPVTPLIKVLHGRSFSYGSSVVEIIQVLLENGASVSDGDWNGRTPLMLAAMKIGSMSAMQLLWDHGAGLYERDREGNTALILAASAGCSYNVSCLLKFIKDTKQILDLQNKEGLTALMCAARFRNQFVIKELIDHGADVNIIDKSGNTALLHLLLTSYEDEHEDEIIRSLIQAGCDVNCQNDNGISPLMLAAKNCLKVTVSVLLDSGAEINAVSKNDVTKTALTFLFDYLHRKRCRFSCLEYLLDRGASSSYVEAAAFHNMIIKGQIKVVPKVIRCGFGPASIKPDRVPTLNNGSRIMPSFSPLCTALCVGNSVLARFFVGNLFLTRSDISLPGHYRKKLMRHLISKNFKECLHILNEISTQPMTLFNLSFVAVSTAVRSSPGREVRVNKLPVPRIIKDKLLFKSQDVELTVSEKHITVANLARNIEHGSFMLRFPRSFRRSLIGAEDGSH